MSVLEAMAAGLPVVASAVGGVPEAVDDGETGALVPPGDPARSAAAIATLVAEPALRERWARPAAGASSATSALEAFRRAHLEVYARALAAGPVAHTAIGRAQARRRSCPPRDLGAEVAQPVAAVDGDPAQRQRIAPGRVGARLARRGDAEARGLGTSRRSRSPYSPAG